MAFTSSNIWSWYQARPKWQKWFLFIFILVLVLIASIATYMVTGRILGCGIGVGPDPLQTGKDATEKHFWDKYNDTKKRDDGLVAELATEEAERDRLRKERKDDAAENKDVHAAIDAADGIADVDAALRDRRRR